MELKQAMRKAGDRLSAKSPNLLFGAGVLLVGGAIVSAVKAGKKSEEVHNEIKEDIQNVKELKDASKALGTDYHKTEYPKDLLYVAGRSTGKLARLYGPTLIFGGAAIGCLTKSHNTLNSRNSSLALTATALTTTLQEYREKIRAEYGEEAEARLFGATVIPTKTDNEEDLLHYKKRSYTYPFSILFDETSSMFKNSAEYNRMCIKGLQELVNHKLRADGYVFLNDVYDGLGLPRTSDGQLYGWLADTTDFIDFGLYNEEALPFLNGDEPRVWLTFNVTGIIYDKI